MWEPSTARAVQSAGAGGDSGAAAHRGGATGGRAGRNAEPALQGVGEALGAVVAGLSHAVPSGQQLTGGQAQVQRHDVRGMCQRVMESATRCLVRGGRRCGTSWCRSPRRWTGWQRGRSSW